MSEQIENLRLLALGNKADESQDDLLFLLIDLAEKRFRLILHRYQKKYENTPTSPVQEIPAELSWIIDEVVIRRFNRIGSEGYSSESVEGHSVNFAESDFKDYESLLDDYYAEDEEDFGRRRKGRMVVW